MFVKIYYHIFLLTNIFSYRRFYDLVRSNYFVKLFLKEYSFLF